MTGSTISLVYDTGMDPKIVAKIENQTGCQHVYDAIQFETAIQNGELTNVVTLKLDSDPVHRYHLSLLSSNDHKQTASVDFNSPAFIYRLQHNNTVKQTIARAMGLKKGLRPTILDATAGMGRDGFLLAALGCKIIFVERSIVIHALLEDGLRRAAARHACVENITLVLDNSIKFLHQQHAIAADVIYLDPMYPDRTKQALVKKEMRMVRQVVGKDYDVLELFNAALKCNVKRVVVKRPKGAKVLGDSKPSFDISGKTTRYDIYLNN